MQPKEKQPKGAQKESMKGIFTQLTRLDSN